MHESRSARAARHAVVLLGAAFGVAILSASGARADGPVQLRSRLGDACLDAPDAGWYTPMVVNPCNGTDFQRWNPTSDGHIESAAFPGQCLALKFGDGKVSLRSCWDWDSRFWTVQPNGQITTAYGCLTVLGGPDPGTWVNTRNCDGTPGQAWDAVP
ncbi:RICIN domain-containing protein [Mycobacterium sp. 1245805.9]|uniref:Rv1419 family lectin n=1 Tax=Mycobacterium sp. 1245805.9 TaxID=1856862 RepID=UPI0009EF136B|nr:RICIN domain-containing protein [Mycobacterium sp. 1245805.9]